MTSAPKYSSHESEILVSPPSQSRAKDDQTVFPGGAFVHRGRSVEHASKRALLVDFGASPPMSDNKKKRT